MEMSAEPESDLAFDPVQWGNGTGNSVSLSREIRK